MERHLDLKERIQSVLDRNGIAVLATQYEGQPHASLMAFTPMDGVGSLLFATYRRTRKYKSLVEDGRVAILVNDLGDSALGSDRPLVVTAIGEAREVPEEDREAAVIAHLTRHPHHEEFLRSPDCALVQVTVGSYEVVGGIDDVQWYRLDDPAAT